MLERKLTRRTLLRVGGCAGISMVACGAGAAIISTQTDLLDRLQNKTDMPLLESDTAWTYADQILTLDLEKVPDLAKPNSAIRLEDDTLPEPLLIVHDTDDYYVFLNKCTHNDQKLDLEDGELKCTCIYASTFDFAGKRQSGVAKDDLTTYTVEVDGSRLVVRLS